MLGGDRVRGVEIVMGSPHDDMLTGKTAARTLMGGAGDDMLVSNGSISDTLAGGPGDDTYVINPTATSGAVSNTITEAAGAAGGTDTIRFTGEDENGDDQGAGTNAGVPVPVNVENAEGSGERDQIDGNALDNVISGGGGNDVLTGGAGDDTLNGGAGDDTFFGGPDDDTINGDAGVDTISGNDGDDTLTGGAGNDTITGGAGNDTIDGGAGNDTLNVGRGDTVTGGDGRDSFVVGTDAGAETTDLTITFKDLGGRESIDLTNIDVSVMEMNTALDSARDSGGNAIVTLPASATIAGITTNLILVVEGRDTQSLDVSADANERPDFLVDAT